MMEKEKTIAISGGCDPVHVGHIRMIRDASKFGKVLFILNSDDWLMRKKGYVFMPLMERYEVLMSIKGVSSVVLVDDTDDSVCHALKMIKPDYFGNGGDRKSDNVPEVALCEELGIELVWNLGGEKIQSSSDLVKAAKAVK